MLICSVAFALWFLNSVVCASLLCMYYRDLAVKFVKPLWFDFTFRFVMYWFLPNSAVVLTRILWIICDVICFGLKQNVIHSFSKLVISRYLHYIPKLAVYSLKNKLFLLLLSKPQSLKSTSAIFERALNLWPECRTFTSNSYLLARLSIVPSTESFMRSWWRFEFLAC